MKSSILKDPVEIILIDSDNVSIALTKIYFDQILGNNKQIIKFVNYSDALNYLGKAKDDSPKIIFLEPNSNHGQDFSFLDRYQLLHRHDYVYIISIPIYKSDFSGNLSYNFVRKHLSKPLNFKQIISIVQELHLTEDLYIDS